MQNKMSIMDGNMAAAYISYFFSELIVIYPITPSSTIAEIVEMWSAKKKKNFLNNIVVIKELQSEAGVAGFLHGSIKTGVLTTTYTSSQGLLLMMPSMFRIAGELLSTVIYVVSRSITVNSLSIFCDHNDVMAVKSTGFAIFCVSNVQEIIDLAPVVHLSSLESKIPFIIFFDGFRTSHEMQKVNLFEYKDLYKMISFKEIINFRKNALNNNNSSIDCINLNSDIYFQHRESINKYYINLLKIVNKNIKVVNKIRNKNYSLIDFYGAIDATEIIISMGSISSTIEQTIDYLIKTKRKVGFLNIHLYRPFPIKDFFKKIPKTVKAIAVLDRYKEVTSIGESIFLDIQSIFYNKSYHPIIIHGRYGLGSKDILPSDIINIFDELLKKKKDIKYEFVIGINDNITHLNLKNNNKIYDLTPKEIFQVKFWGFSSDGTISMGKSITKIIGEYTNYYVQCFFEYDSKKSGSLTNVNLRFGKKNIKSEYLIQKSNFVICNKIEYLYNYCEEIIFKIKRNGFFLLNTEFSEKDLSYIFSYKIKKFLFDNNINFYIINANKLSIKFKLNGYINTIMELSFFKILNIVFFDKIKNILKKYIYENYKFKTKDIIINNILIIDNFINYLIKIDIKKLFKKYDNIKNFKKIYYKKFNNKFKQNNNCNKILKFINFRHGNSLSTFDILKNNFCSGKIFLNKFNKNCIKTLGKMSLNIPKWNNYNCIMCNKCVLICPHAAIRSFLIEKNKIKYFSNEFKFKKIFNKKYVYTIQINKFQCTGCGLCTEICPAKKKALIMNKNNNNNKNWNISLKFALYNINLENKNSIFKSQIKKPLLEFSGACSGCGETIYIKILTQLFGPRLFLINATGCSSIWSGSIPEIPYVYDFKKHAGPVWTSSLLENNAEYGYGIYIGNKIRKKQLINNLNEFLKKNFIKENFYIKKWIYNIKKNKENNKNSIILNNIFKKKYYFYKKNILFKNIILNKNLFFKNIIWIIGGDGWGYDIGFSGLDHLLASGDNINILILNNEIYSNTGGQFSKATSLGAITKFSFSGKTTFRKDLGRIAMAYSKIYIAQISVYANQEQTILAFKEAVKFNGPSLIIAYVSCINHGILGGMKNSIKNSIVAVESGYWLLYRYITNKNFDIINNNLKLDYKNPKFYKIKEFLLTQNRFLNLKKVNSKKADYLLNKIIKYSKYCFEFYKSLEKN